MNYEANDIVSLSQGRSFREKIGMYLSGDKQEAINLGLRELIVNVQDEYEVYKPKNPMLKIKINTKDNIISVSDNMRGIPVGIREDGINSLTAAMLINHSGGKHREGAYSSSVGINGCGNKIVCHTAEWLEVVVNRDGKIWTQSFYETDEGAVPNNEVTQIGETEITGTSIIYKPSAKVYGDKKIDVDALRDMLKQISYFTKGLSIILDVDGVQETLLSTKGLLDGLNSERGIGKPFSYTYETDDCKVELALQWVKNKGEIKGYANGLFMPDGGEFITGFKTALTRTFNSLAKKKFTGEQIRDVLNGFVSVKVKVGQFSNQAKTKLANPEARLATSTAISNLIKDFAIRRKSEFEQIITLLDKVEKAEMAAEKAREKVLQTTKEIDKMQKRKVFSSDKLKDAEFLGEQSVLLLVEGDSAASALLKARDVEKYGVLALKGKPLNCLSNSEDKIFDNDEIKLILSALNIRPGAYDSSKLRYGKIGISVDADSDGAHICLLLVAALHYLCPEFIKEGRLFWLKTPLFVVKKKGQETFYFDDEEFNHRKDTSGEVTRAKGIGALSMKQAKISMFGEQQRLEKLEIDDESVEILYSLMGPDVDPRKEYIFNNIDFSTIKE